MNNLEEYYNKFNEDKRLNTRRGQVEFITNMKYIHKYLKKGDKILDIGAGTGKYSLSLDKEGYEVTAVELVKRNIQIINKKNPHLETILGNALDLSMIKDNTYDVVLLFGPMYHLKKREDQIKALAEAKRVTKKEGIIFVSYCMNDYAIITHGFIEGNIQENIQNQQINQNFKILENGNPLYDYVRIEDIDEINNKAKLKRMQIISSDGMTNYIRGTINKMDEETFELYLKYHLSTCERKDFLGVSTHLLDILKK
ncbi:MAG: class I SAM-dependent methyltransferase [Bacilli bacterium]|nr:class I SAM-dependent methyltransferase [Bacilli bacterium]